MNNINFTKLKNDFDTENIFDAISSFGNQINDSFSIMNDSYRQNSDCFIKIRKEISSVLICGMGGSAIGGDIAKIILLENIKVPIVVNRSETIPNWVDKETLVIFSSYSGNTHETINSYNQSKLRTDKIIAVSSNSGLLNEYCLKYNHLRLDVPLGLQPRCALGYLSSIIILLLIKLNLIDNHTEIKNNLKSASIKLQEKKELSCRYKNIDYPYDNPAILLANKLKDKIPVLYGTETYSSIIALRFKNQLQENAKIMAFSNSYPEINHNEIEGWSSTDNNLIIWLKDSFSCTSKIELGMMASYKLLNKLKIEQCIISLNELYPDKISKLETLYISIYFFDWVTYYLALLKKENPCSINNIEYVKKEIL